MLYKRIGVNDVHSYWSQEHTECQRRTTSLHDETLHHQFDFERFANYLEGIAGGNRSSDTSRAIVADLRLFVCLTPGSSCDVDKLFNKTNLEKFFHHLINDKAYKPTTIAEKIRRLKLAIKYVIHAEDSMMQNQELFIRGSILIELLNQWGHSLSKPIALQRQQYCLKMAEKLPLVIVADEFLANEQVNNNFRNCFS